MTDIPFQVPADKVVAIELPPPMSVNATRKQNWAAKPLIEEWIERADKLVLSAGGMRKIGKLPGKFELTICLDEDLCQLDADNAPKILIDYCRRLEIIKDDNKKYLRRLVIEWGVAPTGCRLTFREWGA